MFNAFSKFLDPMVEVYETFIMVLNSECQKYRNMRPVFWKKLLSQVMAIDAKCARNLILIMFLSVVMVVLGCNKIKHQRRLRYCKEIDNFKCENGGIRMYSKENGLSCWCTSDYVGEHCQKHVSFMSRTISLFRLGNSDVSRGRPTTWWSIFPFTSAHQLKTIYAFHQSAVERLENVFTGANNGGYGPRILPPACPLECCANDKTLPLVKTLYNKIFKRKPTQFIPERKNRNLLLDAFYQYFVLQFSDANSNLTVTASQLYGSDDASERSMRSFSGGKLKTRKINYKHFATNHAFAPYSDVYLKALTKDISFDRSWLSRMITRLFKRAEMLSTRTMLYVLSILWAREHNRVCDELSQKWPLWTDEELYTKAKKIVTGQMMNIMMTEILNLELRPEVDHNYRGSGKPIELYLTMAVSNLPEKLQYSSTNLRSYSNTSQVSETDLKDILQLMMNSNMSMVTAHDDGSLTEQLTKTLMTFSREQCLQGFNNYRRRLGLPAYNSFIDLTGNVETATELEKLYSTVENVELLTGVLTEKSSSGVLPTAKVLSNSFIVNAILTNNLTSKHLWAPDTFGGVEFFNLVKSASLESLVCRNVDNCEELKVHQKPVSFISRVISLFRLGNSDVSRGRSTTWWSIFPFTSAHQLKTIYAFHQSAVERLENMFAGANNGGYSLRILPLACPLECCANYKTLPLVKTLYNKIFKRKPTQFIPERKNRNLLLDAFYQYFVLQFSDANSNSTVTASQLYSRDDASERSMRSFSGGKIKARTINYKYFSTNLTFAPYSDRYFKAFTKDILIARSWLSRMINWQFKLSEMLKTSTLLSILQSMMSSNMIMVTAGQDDGPLTEQLTKALMTLEREQCLHSFNNYRRPLGLLAYNSFIDLTGKVENAKELERLYSTVEKVEVLTGVLKEKSIYEVLPTAKVETYQNVDNFDELKVHRYAKYLNAKCARNLILIMFLSVVIVVLGCTKINHQTRIGYCKEIDNFKCENGGIRMYSNKNGLSCWCTSDYISEYWIHQSAVVRLENVFTDANNGGYGPRILPTSCPLECCANDKTLPLVETLFNKIFKRKPGQFIPDRKNSNVLLDANYQYFVLQFTDANSNLTLSRMIAQLLKRAEMLSTRTMLYVLSIFWAREHNRVCDELSQKWPLWTDEELYTKAKKIVTGQLMKIMMTEILNLELRPQAYHHRMEKIRGSGKPIELYLTMSVSNLPEKFQFSSMKFTSYSNTSQVLETDLKYTLQSMMSSNMIMVTAHDDGPLTEQLTKELMTLEREQCLHSFNNYRRPLGLLAYNSFIDLTGKVENAKELERLYSTVEKVEVLTGVLKEKSIYEVLPTAKVETYQNVDNFDELKVHRYAKYLNVACAGIFFTVLSVIVVHRYSK